MFTHGFDKVAGVKDFAKKVGAGLKSGVKKGFDGITAPFQGTARIGRAAVDTAETVAKTSKKVGEHVEGIASNAREDSKHVSKASRLAAGAGIGAAGAYVGSKLMSMPEAYQRYGYYKNKKNLAKKQLEDMEKKASWFKKIVSEPTATDKAKAMAYKAGDHLHKYRKEYLMGTGTLAAISSARSAKRSADALEKKGKK